MNKEIMLINFNLLDGTKDMEVRSNQKMIIDSNGLIQKIDSKIKIDTNKYEVIDLNNKYLIPGLINLHVHIPGSGNPPKKKPSDPKKLVELIKKNKLFKKIGLLIYKKYTKMELMSGVTTIRSVGGVDDLDTITRDLINEGKLLGPRVLASNTAIAPLHGHMAGTVSKECATVEEGLQQVRLCAEQKVDLIKLMITGGVLDAVKKGEPGVLKMKPEDVKAYCDEAHKLGFKVAAHVESAEGVKVAIENGVDTIEHGAKLTKHEIDLFKKNSAAYICTLSPAIPLALIDAKYSHQNEMVIYNTNVILEGVIAGTKACLDNDIKVGLGTDTGCPFVTHYDTWRELAYFVKYLNVTPKFALYTATLGNAEIARINNETGSIEKGKFADFMVVNENPLDNLKTLSSPIMVSYKGHIIKNPKIKKNKLTEKLLNQFI